MATAGDLATACVRGWADERLADVASRLKQEGGHHCAVFERDSEKFIGLVRMADVAGYLNPGSRLLVDLIPTVDSLRVRSSESAQATAEMFEKFGLSEVVVIDPSGAFVGIATAESVLTWMVRELRRKNSELTLRAADTTTESSVNSPTPIDLPVLIVEDHESSRWALARILASRGVRAVSVGSVADALKAADRQRFAAVLSDIGLPDGNGYELMANLQEQYDVPCVAVTALDEIFEGSDRAKLQLLGRLTKPLHTREIDTLVAALKSQTGHTPSAGQQGIGLRDLQLTGGRDAAVNHGHDRQSFQRAS